MTELEKNPINNKFNFFKKKTTLPESTFIANRASNLIISIFFQPLFFIILLTILGVTNTQEIITFFKDNHITLFSYGLYAMAFISITDFFFCFLNGFKSRKTTSHWGSKWISKAFYLSLTNFLTYYMVASVIHTLAKDVFKTL